MTRNTRLTIAARTDAPLASAEIELAPDFLARYELRHLLGRGGMGMVHAARRRDSGEEVAIKFMLDTGLASASQRFLQEGRLLARLSHPAVVRVHEVGAMSGHPYLVCELLPGGTLKERLAARVRLAPAEAVPLMVAVLGGLHACHQEGIVHRDVKPENVMFDREGAPRLVDLGIAKAFGEQGTRMTQTGTVIGTPAYMSPEQARGEAAGVASDVYAAGVVLYELLAGGPPFVSRSIVEVLHAHISTPPEPLGRRAPGIPAQLAAAVEAALAKRIGDRPASAEELAIRISRSVTISPASAKRRAPVAVPGLRAGCAESPGEPRSGTTAAFDPGAPDSTVSAPTAPSCPAVQRPSRRLARPAFAGARTAGNAAGARWHLAVPMLAAVVGAFVAGTWTATRLPRSEPGDVTTTAGVPIPSSSVSTSPTAGRALPPLVPSPAPPHATLPPGPPSSVLPDHDEAHTMHRIARLKLANRHEDVISAAEEAARRFSANPHFRIECGLAHLALDRPDLATEQFELAIHLVPDVPQRLGMIHALRDHARHPGAEPLRKRLDEMESSIAGRAHVPPEHAPPPPPPLPLQPPHAWPWPPPR